MRIFISADMEGITGISNWDEMKKHQRQSEEKMTADVNAVIEGILDSGKEITEILVADSHSDGLNIIHEKLHPIANLIRGFPRKSYMMSGLTAEFDRVFLVGYHSAVGEIDGLMDHTYSGSVIHQVKINGQILGELEINTAYAASLGVPVVFTSGELNYTQRAEALETKMITVPTKESFGRFAAKLYPATSTHQELKEGARVAMVLERNDFNLFEFSTPLDVELTITDTLRTEIITILPTMKRIDGRTIQFTACDMQEFMDYLLVCLKIGWTN